MHLAEDPKIWYGEDILTLFQSGLIGMTFMERSSSSLILSGD